MCFMCVYKMTPESEREALVEKLHEAAASVLDECIQADDGDGESEARFMNKAQHLSNLLNGRMAGTKNSEGGSLLSSILTDLFKGAMQEGRKVDLSELIGKTVVVPVKINSGDSLETIQAKTKAAMAGPFPTTPVNVGNTPSVNLGADFEFPDGVWPANNVFPLKPTKH